MSRTRTPSAVMVGASGSIVSGSNCSASCMSFFCAASKQLSSLSVFSFLATSTLPGAGDVRGDGLGERPGLNDSWTYKCRFVPVVSKGEPAGSLSESESSASQNTPSECSLSTEPVRVRSPPVPAPTARCQPPAIGTPAGPVVTPGFASAPPPAANVLNQCGRASTFCGCRNAIAC